MPLSDLLKRCSRFAFIEKKDVFASLSNLVVPGKSFLQCIGNAANLHEALMKLLPHPLFRVDPACMHLSLEVCLPYYNSQSQSVIAQPS